MAEHFVRLPLSEQAEILNGLAPELGRLPLVLEKDVWVCWALQQLFGMPERLPMAFKGGTSLSKVYGAIHRFSEDVDVTLDYRGFGHDLDPFDPAHSGTKLKKFSDQLKGFVRDHSRGVIVPFLETRLREEIPDGQAHVEVSDNGEEVRIYYPSALDKSGGYLTESVLIELGGRNITEPNAGHVIRPYIAEHLSGLELPIATATVLAPERTFWEKATLIHVECHRKELKADAHRMSRHWCDLASLADHEIGSRAIANRDLLADVVKHKKVFYSTSYANYDACLAGGFRLAPTDALREAVGADLKAMIAGGMFYGEPPDFDAVMERLRVLEEAINSN
ncbi:MAG: nucleotidyl transferase AbiEii/AbiGii toxin family protein [Proteobacteria bacterium]|nr:nucleotidyl transferase AbiEii/AbiGii toxin family protein [Pseudomonadota bacterium]